MGFLDNLSDSEDEIDEHSLFNHAKRNIDAIIREEADRKAAKGAKKQKPIATSSTSAAAATKSKSKKRKSEHEDIQSSSKKAAPRDLEAVESTATQPLHRIDDTIAAPVSDDTVEHDRPIEHKASSRQDQTQPVIVNVSDDELPTNSVADKAIQAQSSEEEDESDPELAALARRTRLEHRQKLAALRAGDNVSNNTPMSSLANEPEPKIEIFVSSQIPGTLPLRVFLRLSQQLGMVRKAWVNRQELPSGMAEHIYLTHCRRRVYESSTCRSLGLSVNQRGELVMKGAENKSDVDKIHLEAVTDALLDSLKQAEEERSYSGMPSSVSGLIEQPPITEAIIRLVLKAPKTTDWKLKVKPSTTIAKIITAYKRSHQLDDRNDVVLVFDGDELLPDQIISETEITDMDQLEVHIK